MAFPFGAGGEVEASAGGGVREGAVVNLAATRILPTIMTDSRLPPTLSSAKSTTQRSGLAIGLVQPVFISSPTFNVSRPTVVEGGERGAQKALIEQQCEARSSRMTSLNILAIGAALGGFISHGIISFALTVGVLQEYLPGSSSQVDRARSI